MALVVVVSLVVAALPAMVVLLSSFFFFSKCNSGNYWHWKSSIEAPPAIKSVNTMIIGMLSMPFLMDLAEKGFLLFLLSLPMGILTPTTQIII